MFGRVNLKKNSNDRFIPRRMEINVDLMSKESPAPPHMGKEGEFLNYAKVRYDQQIYQNTLRNILFPLDVKVLNFFPPKKFQPRELSVPINQTWPVQARKKPVIGPPEMILDMPHFDTSICYHVADWSSKNCLATIFENEVHMWYPSEEFVRDITATQKRVQYCVKWKSDGAQFAVGLYPNKLGIWDVSEKKMVLETACCPFCEVLCLEWISDNYLVSGCNRGVLTLYSSELNCLKKQILNDSVVTIVVSSDKKLMAVSKMDKRVIVWKVPELEVQCQITCPSIVRALAFHPWKSSVLAMGHGSDSSRVNLWNVNCLTKIARERTTYKNCSIDALTFNPISGELVVSYFVRCNRDQNRGRAIIAVLSDIDTIVEELHLHEGPIRYLLWGSKGKLLASASADENLCIWEFFGNQYEKKKSEQKRHNVGLNKLRSSTILSRTYIR